jgi:DNA-binding transcriptional MerR regulator
MAEADPSAIHRGSMPRGRSSTAAHSNPASLDATAIPDKLYFRIGEVSELTDTKTYVLRFWETEFPTLKPVKSRSGHRLYRREDVQTVFEIKRLLYEKGFTIEGARRQLAGESPAAGDQNELFRAEPSPRDGHALKVIRRELEGILTMLSRKC